MKTLSDEERAILRAATGASGRIHTLVYDQRLGDVVVIGDREFNGNSERRLQYLAALRELRSRSLVARRGRTLNVLTAAGWEAAEALKRHRPEGIARADARPSRGRRADGRGMVRAHGDGAHRVNSPDRPQVGGGADASRGRVFLAYHSPDEEQVSAVAHALRERGFDPWLYNEQVLAGDWFQDAIQDAIPRVDAAIIFFGPAGIGGWQALEIRSFISRCVAGHFRLISALLPGVRELPKDLPFLRELQWVKLGTDADDPLTLDELERGITGERSPKGR